MSTPIIFGSPEALAIIQKDKRIETVIAQIGDSGAESVAERIMSMVLSDYADHLRPRYDDAAEYDSSWYKDMVKYITRILVEARVNEEWPPAAQEATNDPSL